MFGPLAVQASRLRIPSSVFAAVVVGAVLIAINVGLVMLGGVVSGWAERAPEIGAALKARPRLRAADCRLARAAGFARDHLRHRRRSAQVRAFSRHRPDAAAGMADAGGRSARGVLRHAVLSAVVAQPAAEIPGAEVPKSGQPIARAAHPQRDRGESHAVREGRECGEYRRRPGCRADRFRGRPAQSGAVGGGGGAAQFHPLCRAGDRRRSAVRAWSRLAADAARGVSGASDVRRVRDGRGPCHHARASSAGN